jgi:integrase
MKPQNGSIQISRGKKWLLRWRETVLVNGVKKLVMRYKPLGDVTAEHRRNKDRKTGKLRIPDEIQLEADGVMESVRTAPPASVLTTIGEFVADYLKDREKELKVPTYKSYVRLWERYLRSRLSSKVLRDYKRPDAYNLWRDITKDYPHLSRQTLSNIRFFVSGVFNHALNRGLYSGDNPALADLPSGLRGRAKTQAYTVDEALRIIEALTGKPQAQAVVALAWGGGMRKGEISAIRWTDYEPTTTGAILHVRQSAWRGVISVPKTESSADDVKIGTEVCAFIEAYRASIGNPSSGLMFCYSAMQPINLESFARWKIKPMLNRCGVCKKVLSKHNAANEKAEHKHEYKRDESLPVWKGWHAFRRGNATFLAKQLAGNGARAASLMLRHSDQGVTEEHFILNSKQDRRA